MPKFVLTIAVVIGQFFGLALACSCAPPGSPQQEAAKSVTTFAGTVVSTQVISPPPLRRPYLFEEFLNDLRSLLTGKAVRPRERFEPYQIVTFQVERTFHGKHSPVRRVHGGEIHSTCSMEFEQGKRYVVYAFSWQNRLVVEPCSRTGLAADQHAGYQALANDI